MKILNSVTNNKTLKSLNRYISHAFNVPTSFLLCLRTFSIMRIPTNNTMSDWR